MLQDKKVLCACPIRDRAWILPYYLRNLYNLDYPKNLISIYWIVNNSSDESESILHEFKREHDAEYANIEIEVYNSTRQLPKDDRNIKVRQQYIYEHLSNLRNKLLDKTKSSDIDFLFSSDCDILLAKDTLNKLIESDKKIVAALLYNGNHIGPDAEKSGETVIMFKNGITSKNKDLVNQMVNKYEQIGNARTAQMYTNVLRKQLKGNYKHVSNAETNGHYGLISCDFTGASILIAKEVCAKARYGVDIVYGEDLPFCKSAQANGYSLWCNCSAYVEHVQGKEFLEKAKNFGVE